LNCLKRLSCAVSESSKDSAARFFALKSGRKVKLPRRELPRGKLRQPIDLRNPPEKWRFVEGKVPGCFAAWAETVGLRTESITLGVTGKPPRVVAFDEDCYLPGYTACKCHVFSGGIWQKRNHSIVECCARKTFGDGLHASDCGLVTAVPVPVPVPVPMPVAVPVPVKRGPQIK
jgi:hypothetical protein